MLDVEKKNDITKVISMTQFEFQLELDKVRLEQKAIDTYARVRDMSIAYKEGYQDAVDKACGALDDVYFPSEESREKAKQIVRERGGTGKQFCPDKIDMF